MNEKGKEMEVNIADSSVNSADIPKETKSTKNNRGNRGRGKGKGNQNNKPKPDEKPMEGDNSKNDPSFYYDDDPQLLNDMASVPMAYASGLPISINGEKYVVPGVRVLYVRPSINLTMSADASLNATAVKQFSFFRATVSSRLPYQAPDLMIYEMAAGQLYSYIKWCQRIYGTAVSLYVNENRYTNRTLLQVQGVSPDSMVEHLADFRGWLNMFISKVQALSVPATIKYFRRMAMVYSSYYTEGENVKDQIYMYSPLGFWYYNDGNNGTIGANLVYTPLLDAEPGEPTTATTILDHSLLTYKQIIDYGNNMLSSIYASESIAIMSSNIQRAYGANNIISLQLVPEFYSMAPVYDINVLEQMQNATTLPEEFNNYISKTVGNKTYNDWSVKQVVTAGTGATDYFTHLEFAPGIFLPQPTDANYSSQKLHQLAAFFTDADYLLTTTRSAVPPELILELSREMCYGVTPTTQGLNVPDLYIDSCTDVVIASVMFQKTTQSEYVTLTQIRSGLNSWSEHTFEITQELQKDAVDLMINSKSKQTFKSVFKHALNEFVYTATQGTDSDLGSLRFIGMNARIDNMGVLYNQDLLKMNELATFSLFNIKSIVKPY